MATDFSLPMRVRRKLAERDNGNWSTRGSRGSTVSIGGKCVRCGEFLPFKFIKRTKCVGVNICTICHAELSDADAATRDELYERKRYCL